MVTAATLFFPAPRAAPSESTEVLRAQVELSVCEDRGAGTSDPVSARLNEGEGEATWLSGPGPNFERGQRYRYDLVLDGVRTLADITELVIEKPGDDDLCLRELRLLVNERPIFLRTFSGGLWLNGGTQEVTLRAKGAELRSNASWQSYAWSLPEWIASTGAAVPRQEMTERLTSAIATAIRDLGLTWKTPPAGVVVLNRQDDNTLHATTVLALEDDYWPATDVALAFDLRFCANGRALPEIVNVTARQDKPWYSIVYTQAHVAHDEQTLMVLTARLSRMRPVVLVGGVCPKVDARGNIFY